MHPLRTTVLLLFAQLVGGTTTPTPSVPATPLTALPGQATPAPTAPLLTPPGAPVVPKHVLPTATRWSVAVAASPVAPPVVDTDAIFVVLQSGVIAAHKVTDGAVAWEAPLKSDHPIVTEGGRVYVATADQIVALNCGDGSKVWSVQSAPITASLTADGGWLIVATEQSLIAFRSADGSEVWRRDLGGVHVPPTIEGDNLYVPFDDGRLIALDLRTGAGRWSKSFAGPLSEVLAFPDQVLFGTGDKYFFCLRAADGERSWQRVRLGSIVRGRPIADNDHIYVASMDNTVRAYRRANGALLWHPTVPFRPTTGPVLVDGAVIVAGNAAELRAFDGTTGQPAGQITLEESLIMPPAFGKSSDGMLMAAFTGTLTGQWKLVLAGPPPSTPPAPPHE